MQNRSLPQNQLLPQADALSGKSKRRKKWKKIVGSLSCVVVFITTYMMILPAITMETTTYCNRKEHRHETACYERRLICGFDESEAEVPEADIPEPSGLEAGELPVTEPESGEAPIGETESSEPQTMGHVHTDACYESVLVCSLEEHEHAQGCYANPEADRENASVWERSLSGAVLSGVWADDIVSVAQTQLGCRESTLNYIVTEDGRTKGISRYGQWYGDDYGDWCAMFVSFCLNYAGIPDTAVPYESSCRRWIEKLSDEALGGYVSAGAYSPLKGDIIFFDMDKDSVSDHVGIVAKIQSDAGEIRELTVIEGNSSDRVQYVSYEPDDARILGFGRLPANPAQLQDSDDGQPEEEFSLTADAGSGITVRLSGPAASLPFPADEISVTADIVTNDDAAALVDEAVAGTNEGNRRLYLFDVRLWHAGVEIEPVGPVVMTFEGIAGPGENDLAGVFHVNEELAQATDMNAELTEDGSVVVDTDHFSLYGVMLLSEAGGSFVIQQTVSATWDSYSHTLSSVIFSAVNSSQDNVIYRVEYSDNDGSSWTSAVTASGTTKKGVPCYLEASGALTNAPVNRIFRVYGYRNNNVAYAASVSLYDILDSVKDGFSEWLSDSYVQSFGGTALPQTLSELYAAFAVYYELPTLTIAPRMVGNTLYVDAETEGTGTYTYVWEYRAADNSWTSLCEETSASIDASIREVLLDGGRDVRCLLYENGQLKTVSNVLFVNPNRQLYDSAIAEMNAALNLGTLAIGGDKFTNYFYYGNVAKDSRVPFSDARSYADYLARLYLDNGGGESGLTAVRSVWNKYLYDLYDPSPDNGTIKNINGNYPGAGATYGDKQLGWSKDTASSFHGTAVPIIDDLNYNFLEGGVDYGNFVSNLNKTATAVAPGDDNTERKYDITLLADAQAKARGPVAMVLQIQTSWQMFDLSHANALAGQGYTEVGAVANNSELATLYDIKQALLRFVDYMEQYYPGNNLVLGITEVQHAGSQTMFSGTDGNGNELHVSNKYDVLRSAIRAWDSFGNCEHVHYDTNALVSATSKLVSNLAGWKDFYGEDILYDDIQKVAVIIGGPTENSSSTNGYACTLPWSTFQSAGLNSVYGIRTNNGTSNGAGLISWLDYSANNTGERFVDGTGSTFTEKYVATTEEAVFRYLVQIAEIEMKKKGIEIKAPDKYVDNVTVTDVISDEFALDAETPIQAIVRAKDGTIESQRDVSLTDSDLSIVQNADGTTTITYNFGTVYNTKKCELRFRVQAKDDYIGSNNVFSNLDTPDLEYTHKKLDHLGNLTGEQDIYHVRCFDTPQVNVPIRFTTVNGDKVSILVGEQVDLADLSEAIVQNAQDLVDNYDQINGTLSYRWTLPDGTTMDAGSVVVSRGSIGEQTFPDRSCLFEGAQAGQYTGTLTVTFTPEAVDAANRNFSNADTAVAVNSLANPGNVWINVRAADSTEEFYVRKVWIGDPPAGTTSIKFHVLANGEVVTNAAGQPVEYEITAQDGWETLVSGLPAVKDGVVIDYTVVEVSGPAEYFVTYRTESRIEEDYAARATLSFTAAQDKNNASLRIYYTYNGEALYLDLPMASYKKNTSYSFTVDDLPLSDAGAPYACTITSIIITSDNNKTFSASSMSATTEKYLRGSTNTPVKVITNTPAYELPETGGEGTALYTMGGLLLACSAAAILLYRYTLRRKEGLSSS